MSILYKVFSQVLARVNDGMTGIRCRKYKLGPGENVTLSAPLEHINVHVRGGSVLALQQPKLTTGATRRTPYSLLVALGENEDAKGDLYLDDGVSLVPNATRLVTFTFANNSLSYTSEGSYHASQPLANITITGLQAQPKGVSLTYGNHERDTSQIATSFEDGVLKITGTGNFTADGAFQEDLKLNLKY
ncbi:hypothetical protein N0V90_009088 [Kalmusia sp. IMI 367209]|nr:hypothetical protein N0V90_009088 [Kalmusia sp. IMI 367209]